MALDWNCWPRVIDWLLQVSAAYNGPNMDSVMVMDPCRSHGAR